MSTKTVSTFIFAISQLADGLGIKSWAFFIRPASVDSKTALDFIPREYIGQYIQQTVNQNRIKIQHLLALFL